MRKLITIGREYGSGGRELGKKLATELGIAYYDKEILAAIAEKTSMSPEYISEVIEGKPRNLYPVTIGQSIYFADNFYFQQEQSIYNAQAEIVTELAEKSDCVIVGRCADFILKKYSPFRIFVHADLDARIERCVWKNEGRNIDMTPKEVKKQILSIDKNRGKYYEFYTGNKWGEKKNYDLCINTTNVNLEEFVPHLAKFFE